MVSRWLMSRASGAETGANIEAQPFPAGRLGGATLPADHTPTPFAGCLLGHRCPNEGAASAGGKTLSRTQNQRRGERGAENALLQPAQLGAEMRCISRG